MTYLNIFTQDKVSCNNVMLLDDGGKAAGKIIL